MYNNIELRFDKTTTRLVGNSNGKDVYHDQVNGRVGLSNITRIIFPEHIIKASSSFTQGFFEEIITNYGVSNIGTKIIVCGSETLVKSMMDNIL